jgi:hypothetical protein
VCVRERERENTDKREKHTETHTHVHFIGLILRCEVKADRIRQVDIHLSARHLSVIICTFVLVKLNIDRIRQQSIFIW